MQTKRMIAAGRGRALRGAGVPVREAIPAGRGPARVRGTGIYEKLRRDIICCTLPPGYRLRTDEARLRYAVGLSPLREALQRLTADGLVETEENKGFRVARLTRADLVDLSQSRIELESIAMRQAIEHGDDAWEGDLVSAFRRMELREPQYLERGSADEEWRLRHSEFHSVLLAGSPSPIIRGYCRALQERTSRYRQLWFLRHQRLHPERDVLAEHAALMKAVLKRDAKLATQLTRQHIQTTAEHLLSDRGLFEEGSLENSLR